MQLSRIGRRPSRKRQAVDNVASMAKVWSEWQLAKRASKGVAKGTKTAGKAWVAWRVLPVRALVIAGGAAAGIGALWAWRKRGGDAEPWSVPAGADDAASTPPASADLGSGATAPAPGAPDRIKVTADPAATVQAASSGDTNGATKISDPPAAAPEAEAPAEADAPADEEPEAAGDPDPGAEGGEALADADTTKVSDKPAED